MNPASTLRAWAGLIALLALSAAVFPAAAQNCVAEPVGDFPPLWREVLNDLVPEIRLRCAGAGPGRVKVTILFEGGFTNASVDIGGHDVTAATARFKSLTGTATVWRRPCHLLSELFSGTA